METWANKYRPTTLEDVIGQEEAVELLRHNVIEKQKYACTVLFGPPGTGKTTLARIVAKTFNPNGTGIVEIDGASNNGVENVRNIIEKCKLSPIGADYHVYLIDEVHMLSTNAFNALLKILEEPPAHVKFIFCTTDIGKIPPSVISRLLKVPVKSVSTDLIVNRLADIAEVEWLEHADGALLSIANRACGCVRNAIKYLESCSHIAPLTVNSVSEVLGIPDFSLQVEVIYAIVNGDVYELFRAMDRLGCWEMDAKTFLDSLIEVMYDVAWVCYDEDAHMNTLPEFYRGRILDMLKLMYESKVTLDSVMRILDKLLDIKWRLQGVTDGWSSLKCELVTINVG